MRRQKKAQYSVEMIVLVFMIIALQVFFFIHFTQERQILNQLSLQDEATLELQKVSNCLSVVEGLGNGANCSYYLLGDVGGVNYTVALYQNSTILSLETNQFIVFSSYSATLNQTYENLTHEGVVFMDGGEVQIQ